MKERPILFSAPMVRALLDGSKTQTRRIAKVPANATDVRYWAPPSGRSQPGWADPGVNYWTPDHSGATVSNHLDACPYGQPGDRLWVRETHAPQSDCWGAWHNWMKLDRKGPKPIIHYAADGGDPYIEKWRPSIHMPRWASRILLEITGVRVERLQDISEADAIAEGIECDSDGWRDYLMPSTQCCINAIDSYRTLWESINGAGSWDANPWVWVVEFKRMCK